MYTKDLNYCINEFKLDKENGLTNKQVIAQREVYGENKLKEKSQKSLFSMVLKELLQFLNMLLIAAAVISIIISFRTQWAGFLVPFYIIAKGFFLGGFSAYAHKHFSELPYQAIGVTIVTFFVMLLLS